MPHTMKNMRKDFHNPDELSEDAEAVMVLMSEFLVPEEFDVRCGRVKAVEHLLVVSMSEFIALEEVVFFGDAIFP